MEKIFRGLFYFFFILFLLAAFGSLLDSTNGNKILTFIVMFLGALVLFPPIHDKIRKYKPVRGYVFGLTSFVLLIIGSFLNGVQTNSKQVTVDNIDTKIQSNQEVSVNVKTEVAPKAEMHTKDELQSDKVAKIPSNWSYSTSEDKMRGSTKYFANIASENHVDFNFPYGRSNANIILRSDGKSTDVIVSVDNGQFNCGFNGCKISIKMDSGHIKSYSMAMSDDGSHDVLFMNDNVKSFIQGLKIADTVMIEAPFYDFGNAQYEFKVAGLKWEH
nr:MAG TPA: type VI secretion protein [Caudoviricetes sp.]